MQALTAQSSVRRAFDAGAKSNIGVPRARADHPAANRCEKAEQKSLAVLSDQRRTSQRSLWKAPPQSVSSIVLRCSPDITTNLSLAQGTPCGEYSHDLT